MDAEHADGLLEPGPDARLGVARTRGRVRLRTVDAVAWVVVEQGEGTLRVADTTVDIHGRRDVFEGPGWSALLGPDDEAVIDGDVAATVVWRAADRSVDSRVIDPATVPDEARGEGTTARRVRTYVPEGPLITGETLNPPGGWSSWPPHRHAHEEAYLYRFEPSHGFGVHVGYDEGADRPVIVRDGNIERITTGWHPVVAAPGFQMYYLWALAGDADVVATLLDPRYA